MFNMKIYYPYKTKPRVSQKYDENLATYYKEKGLVGHGAWDMYQIHGTPILCGVDGYVFSVTNQDNKDLMKYRAVYTLVEQDGIAYEVSYGHLGEIYVKKGDKVKIGDTIGTQSNTGTVFSGGMKITKEMKESGSTAGSHLHFQVRLLKKATKREAGKKYLFETINGSLYEIPLFKNGFNGCIDPAPFMQDKTAYDYATSLIGKIVDVFKPTSITRTLRYGMRGDDVKVLQKALGIKSDGIFGIGTEKAVKDFQKKHKLVVDGICGKITKAKLNI